MYQHAANIERTLAGFHSLGPPVINVSVAGTPAVLEPSTSRSATTDSAGLLKLAALWARHRIRWRNG